MKKHTCTALSAAILLASAPHAAIAADASPSISGEISFELQNDWNYASDDRENLNNNLSPTVEPSVTFQLSPRWSVFAHAVMEPVGDATKFENRAFEDIGLYMEDLYVEFSGDQVGAKAGKLNPGFGVAWDRAAGLYGTDLAEDYETSERIGIVGDWRLANGEYGSHTLSAATFFADTTFLSQSALRGRGDNRKEDGGLSNTESFESFVFALNGEKMPSLGNLGYHLSFRHQAEGEGNTADEQSIAAAGFSKFDLGGDVTFEPLFEAVHQTDQGGTAGTDRLYLTLSGQIGWKGWNVAASWTDRETDTAAATATTDAHFQLSAGYAFDFGLSIDVGWKTSEDGGIETRTLGAVAAYAIEF